MILQWFAMRKKERDAMANVARLAEWAIDKLGNDLGPLDMESLKAQK